MERNRIFSSFRDQSGFVFKKEEIIYRQINISYKKNYEKLIKSGLYKRLVDENLIISHKEVEKKDFEKKYMIIEPEKIEVITYPYEWSFSQYKEAALKTLEIQKIAIEYGMSLKDATAYNMQIKNGNMIFIDTLSFEEYIEGEPWVAYKQFCQHFLSVLVLVCKIDVRFISMMRDFIDGIPLDLVAKILKQKSVFNLGIFLHIKMHSKSIKINENKNEKIKRKHKFSKISMLGLIDNLKNTIKNLPDTVLNTEWADYYDNTNYTKEAFDNKKEIITKFLFKVNPKSVLDMGANNGFFSRIAAKTANYVISADYDSSAVEKNWLSQKNEEQKNIVPVIIDITNPSPAIGWNNNERLDFKTRSKVDLTMSLALIHHLAISNNIPFEYICTFFSEFSEYLILEFVPKSDSQVKRLLQNREDIFDSYCESGFEKTFQEKYSILEKNKILKSERTMYLLKRRNNENSK